MMRNVVSGTSWDATANKMHDLIHDALRAPRGKQGARPGAAAHKQAIVIGSGPTGLSAAFHLGKGSLLLEQNSEVGGWCRSVVDNGFTFDHAGHIMFSNDPYVHELYEMLLGANVHWQDREAWIYSKQVYTRYPFQGALHGLPPDVLKDCLVGAIEARFGPLKTAAAGHLDSPAVNGASPSSCKAESITDCCADGVAESTLTMSAPPPA